MKKIPTSLIVFIIYIFFTSCSDVTESTIEQPSVSSVFTIGSGVFNYSEYAPFANKPIGVYYHIPENTTPNSPVVFVFHGAGRNAEDYRNAILSKSDEHQFIAIVPEFSITNFSGGDAYNLGNVFIDGDNPSTDTLNPEEEWTFSVIEPLFDFIKQELNNTALTYSILGHSAGGQFSHRFAQFKANARVNKLVSSASGWYTVPDLSIDFPYGFKETPLEDHSFLALFSKKIIIQIGELDNNPNAAGLRHNQYADAQGLHRYNRALHFFNQSKQIVEINMIPINWELQIIPGQDHSYELALKSGADLLFN